MHPRLYATDRSPCHRPCARRRPDVFPKGLSYVHAHTNYTFGLHNRHFSLENVYAKQNGGKWSFTCGPEACLPLEQEFWDWLIADKVGTKGMTVYWQGKHCSLIPSLHMLPLMRRSRVCLLP